MHNLEWGDSEGVKEILTQYRDENLHIYLYFNYVCMILCDLVGHIFNLFFKRRRKIDLFLSYHRTKENKIFSHLYKATCKPGTTMFNVDEYIKKGDVIGTTIEKVVWANEILIQIFSLSYLDSY